MSNSETILLKRKDVSSLITEEECIAAVEEAFSLYARGQVPVPGILGIHADKGGFHIKAGLMGNNGNYFVAKANANFPQNAARFGLPTIQGVVVIFDSDNGRLLGVMDSIELTILRTGAATAVAAKYLSRKNSKTISILGCGNQGRVSVRMLSKVRMLETVYLYDVNRSVAEKLAEDLQQELGINFVIANDAESMISKSDICVTCTTSRVPLIDLKDVPKGIFIAAVGSDSDTKQELDSNILKSSRVVTDITDQGATIGELHHAIAKGLMKKEDVYAELGEIISGKKAGRTSEDEIFVFDSTGMALQDVATASIVLKKAGEKGMGYKMNFAE